MVVADKVVGFLLQVPRPQSGTEILGQSWKN